MYIAGLLENHGDMFFPPQLKRREYCTHVVYLKQYIICNLLVNMFKPLKIAPWAAFSPFHHIVLFHLDVRTVPSKSIYPTGTLFFPSQKKNSCEEDASELRSRLPKVQSWNEKKFGRTWLLFADKRDPPARKMSAPLPQDLIAWLQSHFPSHFNFSLLISHKLTQQPCRIIVLHVDLN